MRVLYVKEQGSLIRKSSERIIVEKNGVTLLDIPAIKLDSLVLFGNIQISSQAMKFLLEKNCSVALMSMRGEFLGSLQALQSRNILLRIRQYEIAVNNELRLPIAKLIVQGKLENMKALFRQGIKNYDIISLRQAIRDFDYCAHCLKRKNAISSLMGVEGHASSIYYKNFGHLIRSEELLFAGRNRRPPRDPVNALLSFTYVVLGNEIASLLEATGFDPYVGIYHGIQYGRKSLVFDMLEEFRPLCDRFVIRLVNLGCLKKDDFIMTDNGACYLEKAAFRTYFEQYETYMLKSATGPGIRDVLREQVMKMKNTICRGEDYCPWEMH